MEPQQQKESDENLQFQDFGEFDSYVMAQISTWDCGFWHWEKKHGWPVLVLRREGNFGKIREVRFTTPLTTPDTSDAAPASSPSSDKT